METTFQTSFIPKRPLVEDESKKAPVKKSAGVIGLIAWIAFITALLATGGAYLYREYLAGQKVTQSANLERERQNFESELIAQMQRLDARINATELLISKHAIMSPVFEVLQDTTLETIRFTEFSYTTNDAGMFVVSMTGEAKNYSSIALQAEEFGKNSIIRNPVFSNLALDDQKGIVIFELEFLVDANYLLYQNVLAREQQVLNTAPPAQEVQ